MATATKNKKVTAIPNTNASGINIPSAIRNEPTPTSSDSPVSGLDLLNQFAGTAPVAPKAKNARSVLDLKQHNDLIVNFGVAKSLYDIFESVEKTTKAALRAVAFPAWIKLLWEAKTQPQNPLLVAIKKNGDVEENDVESMYIVQERFKITATSPKELIEGLVAFGVDKIEADTLTKNEIDFSPAISINFNELMNGKNVDGEWVAATNEEKAVAGKALKLLMSVPDTQPLTETEKALLISRKPRVTVKDGFYQRVADYAKTYEQLLGIFKVITPTEYPKGAKILGDKNEAKERLICAAAKTLGVKIAVVK